MTTYQTVPGVIQTSIAGEYLLVAAKEVQGHRASVTEINETSAFLWQQLKAGCSIEALFDAVRAEYDIEDGEEVRTAVESFVKEMLDMGYIREVEKS